MLMGVARKLGGDRRGAAQPIQVSVGPQGPKGDVGPQGPPGRDCKCPFTPDEIKQIRLMLVERKKNGHWEE
jgi:hypothetical protein